VSLANSIAAPLLEKDRRCSRNINLISRCFQVNQCEPTAPNHLTDSCLRRIAEKGISPIKVQKPTLNDRFCFQNPQEGNKIVEQIGQRGARVPASPFTFGDSQWIIMSRIDIETTIPSFYDAVRTDATMVARRQWRREWFDLSILSDEIVISAVVLDELERGTFPGRTDAILLM
jgi:hypothetical protein